MTRNRNDLAANFPVGTLVSIKERIGNPNKGWRATGRTNTGMVVGYYTALGANELLVMWEDDTAPRAEDGRRCHPRPLTIIG